MKAYRKMLRQLTQFRIFNIKCDECGEGVLMGYIVITDTAGPSWMCEECVHSLASDIEDMHNEATDQLKEGFAW